MRLLRILAFPISLVYAVVVHVRNYLYDTGFFSSQDFSTAIVNIGNLSTGGTGKTPMVSFLMELLPEEYEIVLLSRGYRRKSRGFVLADDTCTVADLGDEPFQLYRKHSLLTVAVDADRRNGINILERRIKPDVIILDDAFQHRKVKADFSFLLTSHDQLYVDDWYLPTGNLRDAKNQAIRADIIVVTKCPELPSEQERVSITKKLKPKPYQQVVFGTLKYADLLIGHKGKISLEEIKNKRIALVTGIANPEPLVRYLKERGIYFSHLKYADHHFFSDSELEELKTYEIVLTTEKDFMRLEAELENAYYLEVGHAFSDTDKEIIKNELERVIRPPSS